LADPHKIKSTRGCRGSHYFQLRRFQGMPRHGRENAKPCSVVQHSSIGLPTGNLLAES